MSLSETSLDHYIYCQPNAMIRCLDLDVLAMARNHGNDLHLCHTEDPEWHFLPEDLQCSTSGASSRFRKALLWRIMLCHISLLCSVRMHKSKKGASFHFRVLTLSTEEKIEGRNMRMVQVPRRRCLQMSRLGCA